MRKDASKKKGKKISKATALEVVNEDWRSFSKLKEQELTELAQIRMQQEQTNNLLKEKTYA